MRFTLSTVPSDGALFADSSPYSPMHRAAFLHLNAERLACAGAGALAKPTCPQAFCQHSDQHAPSRFPRSQRSFCLVQFRARHRSINSPRNLSSAGGASDRAVAPQKAAPPTRQPIARHAHSGAQFRSQCLKLWHAACAGTWLVRSTCTTLGH